MAEKDEKGLLNEFLDKFPADKLSNLKLEEYTSTGSNRKDFTYWVEMKLGFGGIKGGSSFKFGIYKYNKKPKTDKKSGNLFDCEHAWAKKYGETKEIAFNTVRTRIIKVVEAVSGPQKIDYDGIEKIDLGDAFKWKIAFLYSKSSLVPVYQKEALVTAANRIGVLPKAGKNKITIAVLQKALMDYYDQHSADYGNDINCFGSYVWQLGTTNLSQSNQIIKYGAPGTGKTFTVKNEVEEYFDIWKLDSGISHLNFEDHYEFVQFHPSYSYEDFIEGIKPIIIPGSSTTELKLRDGIFKSFCKRAAKYELWLLKIGLLKDKSLDEVTIQDVKAAQEEKSKEESPFISLDNAKDDDLITDYIPPYFFVIDEINRADLSRVFGELMYCLEYRGYKGRIKTQYSELESGDTIFYEDGKQHYFFIPNNVYIIGTMNTIDRSIESFDFALRRRFLWQRIDPNEKVLKEYFDKKGENELADFIIPLWKELNKKIYDHPLLGEDYQIGHSYLMKLDKYPNCTKTSYRDVIWDNHIQPILEEYFRGTVGAKDQIKKLKEDFCEK